MEMERWRAFFAQAEADVWTIINQAILLAASDFPAEFRDRRCEIAENLFARQLHPPARSVEVTRLSGSVITVDAENEPDHKCRKDVPRHLAEFDVKKEDTQSRGNTATADTHGVAELDRRLHNIDDSKVDMHHRAMEVDPSVQNYVAIVKEKIIDATDKSEDEILKSLQALEGLKVDVEILKSTDIGREVNKFRKHPSAQIRNLVKQLVRTWKNMVDEWVNGTEDVPNLDSNGNGNKEGMHSNLLAETGFVSTGACMPVPKPCLYKPAPNGTKTTTHSQAHSRLSHRSGCSPRGVKICSEYVAEEMGSSRVESDELDRVGLTEVDGSMLVVQSVKGHRHPVKGNGLMAMKSNISSSGPGRSVPAIPEVKRVITNGNFFTQEHHKDPAEKTRRNYNMQGETLLKTGHMKVSIAHKLSSAADEMQAAEKFDISKRRLPNESQHTENAKKQRTVESLKFKPC